MPAEPPTAPPSASRRERAAAFIRRVTSGDGGFVWPTLGGLPSRTPGVDCFEPMVVTLLDMGGPSPNVVDPKFVAPPAADPYADIVAALAKFKARPDGDRVPIDLTTAAMFVLRRFRGPIRVPVANPYGLGAGSRWLDRLRSRADRRASRKARARR